VIKKGNRRDAARRGRYLGKGEEGNSTCLGVKKKIEFKKKKSRTSGRDCAKSLWGGGALNRWYSHERRWREGKRNQPVEGVLLLYISDWERKKEKFTKIVLETGTLTNGPTRKRKKGCFCQRDFSEKGCVLTRGKRSNRHEK